jgi:hypothetical protein
MSYMASFVVSVDGFIPRAATIPIPQDPTFPITFTPPAPVDLALHRLPTAIRGRVVQKTPSNSVPLVGAPVTVSGIWRTPPPANLAVPPDPPNLVALKPTLSFDRAAGVGQLRSIVLTPVAGQDKVTVDAVPSGTNPFRLSDGINLNVGDVVIIDPSDPDLAEYLPVALIAKGSTPAELALVTFTYAPVLPHQKGTVVRKVLPGATGPAKAFTQDGWVGDICVFLSDVTDLAQAQAVEISGGTAPAEYRTGLTFLAQTDDNGYYRLPPLSRVAQLQVNASFLALTLDQTFQPDYGLSENALDFSIQ